MSESPTQAQYQVVGAAGIADVLRRARKVVLLAHINPDADSLGCALALGLALEHLGKTPCVAFDHPEDTPESLSELPGQHLLQRDLPASAELVISMDAASISRLGSLSELFAAAETSVVIDHHASNPGFGRLNWIDPSAEATAILVVELIDVLGVPLDSGIATNLYAGIATDTVNFRFASDSVHRLAARLLSAGVRPADVLRPILDSHPFAWLGMLGTVLSNATLNREACGGSGLVAVPVRLADAYGLRQEELDSIIDIVRTAQEAGVAAVMKQSAEWKWQVSLRSRNGIDVGRVAMALGGGGHPRAAGYTYLGEYESLMAQLVEALDASAADLGGTNDGHAALESVRR